MISEVQSLEAVYSINERLRCEEVENALRLRSRKTGTCVEEVLARGENKKSVKGRSRPVYGSSRFFEQ